MGLGRRTFAPGEVLTASNVMNYLQDQAVMNFAGTAARGSAIGTAVSEGMVSYLNDTDSLEVYRAVGTAAPSWQPVAFQSYVDLNSGLVPMIPTSISVGSGSGTVNNFGTISFTGASSVSINGVFTSAYRNYVVKLETACSANSDIRAYFRRAGTNYTGTNQHQAGILVNWSGAVSSFSAINTAHVGLGVTVGGVDRNFSATINLSNPQIATPTTSQIHAHGFIVNSAMNQTVMSFGNYQSEQYDGMTFFPAAAGSNITGTLQFYGYR